MDKLDHAYFENITFSGAATGTLLSISARSDGQRLKLNYEHQDGKVISSEWTKEKLTNPNVQLTHVVLERVNGSDSAPSVDLTEVQVSPSFYPDEAIDVALYVNGAGEHWAIGRDTSNNLWTFFKKPTAFGDYWIASEVLASQKNENERIDEKIRKGYQPVSSAYKFNPASKSLIVR